VSNDVGRERGNARVITSFAYGLYSSRSRLAISFELGRMRSNMFEMVRTRRESIELTPGAMMSELEDYLLILRAQSTRRSYQPAQD
jgi:hypothetical protein